MRRLGGNRPAHPWCHWPAGGRNYTLAAAGSPHARFWTQMLPVQAYTHPGDWEAQHRGFGANWSCWQEKGGSGGSTQQSPSQAACQLSQAGGGLVQRMGPRCSARNEGVREALPFQLRDQLCPAGNKSSPPQLLVLTCREGGSGHPAQTRARRRTKGSWCARGLPLEHVHFNI